MESDPIPKPGLWLLIDQKWYGVERITFDKQPTFLIGWKLFPWEDTQGHGPYSVIRNGPYFTCECADFTMQKQKIGELCKHIVACRKVGLI